LLFTQTANWRPVVVDLRALVEVPLALELFLADAVLHTSAVRRGATAVFQADARDGLHLPPAALPIQVPNPRQLANAGPGGDRLDIRQVADKREGHSGAILTGSGRLQFDRSRDTKPVGVGRRRLDRGAPS